MTTIAQLPSAPSVGSGDLLPISQAGTVYAATVSQVVAGLQTQISVPTGELLGRVSTGAGGPESVTLGTGLAMSNGALFANGGDHAGFPVQAAMTLADELVVNANGEPSLLPVTALRGLFSAGNGVSISGDGVIGVTVSSVAGPAGPQGTAGPVGPAGPAGPAGAGLSGPTAGSSASSVGAADYVALWQNGALAWMPYGQFLGGQTIDQLPAAGPVADGDQLLVAQGGNTMSVQNFGGLWSYVQSKLPGVMPQVVELTANTVLDATDHNNRVLVASAPITLTANFANIGAGFSCTLINLAPGVVTMGTGIASGSGTAVLPPGAATELLGLTYSGGSMVWWSGVVPNAPTITVGSISPPMMNTALTVNGGIFNDAPTALDYSTDGGNTWTAAPSPVITLNAYSLVIPGLAAGTYTVRVRDHNNAAVVGVSNSFTVAAPTITLGNVPSSVAVNASLALTGTVSPASSAVQVGLSASATTAPAAWVNAVTNNGTWTASLTPTAAGTVYVWARQDVNTSVQAVSGAVSVVVPALSVTAPSTGTAGTALAVTGSVAPVVDAVNVQLATQNSAAPSTGWTAATNANGTFSAALTSAAAGTYYVWAQDPASGLTAVSGAISVAAASNGLTYGINAPTGSFTHGSGTIPLNGAITPAQNVATQVALSTSNTVAPGTGWQAASVINSNSLWAIYYTTPATAGSYYVWVQTTAGANTTVSSFTIAVS